MNPKMKAAQISQPGGDWELVEREIPEPAAEQVRVKVEACGIPLIFLPAPLAHPPPRRINPPNVP